MIEVASWLVILTSWKQKTDRPRKYWYNLKQKLEAEESKSPIKCRGLKMKTQDGSN